MTRLHDDADGRLTDFEHQVQRADEYAELQERYLTQFGEKLASSYPWIFRKKRRGAATYWLLAGAPDRALPHLRRMPSEGQGLTALALRLYGCLPASVCRQSFIWFRRSVRWIRNARRRCRGGSAGRAPFYQRLLGARPLAPPRALLRKLVGDS